jgi:S-adenosylmethionine:tRNA ribosyltransferase-isomerase
MRVALFDFALPDDLVAQEALEPRDAARLMHVHAGGITDAVVRDLPALLNPGDLLVFNDSRVIPARLFCDHNSKRIEVLLHQQEHVASASHGEVGQEGSQANIWVAFARPAKKLKADMRLCFAEGFYATVLGRTEDGQVRLAFDDTGAAFYQKLEQYGHMPLPPYIARADRCEDQTRYQTIYARERGSVAAPTAGLHFTDRLFAALEARGVQHAFVTLHVGAGTFQPVKVDDTDAHQMHHEWAMLSEQTAQHVRDTKARGGKVVAVGTTAMRTLETAAPATGEIAEFAGSTSIFITPGYPFKIVDRLLTNFHLPKSTLFMLVSAFSGLQRMQAAYAHAISNRYRFYSYGDACLLDKLPDIA